MQPDAAAADARSADGGDALARAVVRLAGEIARAEPGALAALRRMDPQDGPWPAPFWRLLHACGLREAWGAAEDTAQDWAWVVHALALLTPTGRDEAKAMAHEPGLRLGAVLAEADVSEARLARLLAAGQAQRRIALVRVCRRLAQTDARVDAVALARLLLQRMPEKPLRRLADQYYAALDAAARRASEESADA
jgi:CRISPR system Cascade subunit CasB